LAQFNRKFLEILARQLGSMHITVLRVFVWIVIAALCLVPKPVDSHLTGNQRENRESPPIFRELPDTAGLKFRHYNGMTGKFFLPEVMGAGVALFDFDNDGSPEIYIACGMLTNSSEQDLMSFFWRQVVANSPATRTAAPDYENGWNALDQWIREDYSWNGREPNVLYARRGGRFYDFSCVSGIDFADDSRAFAVTDFDGDGNLDLLLKSRLGPQVRALRNDWGGRKSIAIALTGVQSNRDGIGAFVEVRHAGGLVALHVAAGSGYISQHTKVLHVGLADSSVAEEVRVQWPSGQVQEFENLPAGFRYQIVEGSRDLKRQPFLRRNETSKTRVSSGPDAARAVTALRGQSARSL